MQTLARLTRHRCFISYHHEDEEEVQDFIQEFDHRHDVFVSRGIGASMAGDVIDSDSSDYIMRRVRELYLNDSTVTIVMVGKCTWARKFVDWEIAASLRNTAVSSRSGLMAIALPSVSGSSSRRLPPRADDNVDGDSLYARWWKYPTSAESLANYIGIAYSARTSLDHVVNNRRQLFSYNKSCP